LKRRYNRRLGRHGASPRSASPASPRQNLRLFRSASIGLRGHVRSLTVRAECSALARATQTLQVCTLVEAINGRFGIRLEGADGSDLHPFLDTSAERGELSAAGRLAELGLIEARDSPCLSVVVRRLLSLPRFEARRSAISCSANPPAPRWPGATSSTLGACAISPPGSSQPPGISKAPRAGA
jgi:hypothetical protein